MANPAHALDIACAECAAASLPAQFTTPQDRLLEIKSAKDLDLVSLSPKGAALGKREEVRQPLSVPNRRSLGSRPLHAGLLEPIGTGDTRSRDTSVISVVLLSCERSAEDTRLSDHDLKQAGACLGAGSAAGTNGCEVGAETTAPADMLVLVPGM